MDTARKTLLPGGQYLVSCCIVKDTWTHRNTDRQTQILIFLVLIDMSYPHVNVYHFCLTVREDN